MNDESCARQRRKSCRKSHAAIAMFFAMLLSYILNSIDRGLFSVLAIEVRDAMSLSLPQVGLASTMFTLGMGLAGIPTGYLLSSTSRKSVVLLGLFVFSLATLLTAYATGLPDLLAYRFVSGLGEAMQVTALIAIGASYFLSASRVGDGRGFVFLRHWIVRGSHDDGSSPDRIWLEDTVRRVRRRRHRRDGGRRAMCQAVVQREQGERGECDWRPQQSSRAGNE